ncbi:MAG: helix-turn-helix domain-containing protein [Lactobacillus sp.]|jgi:transcriptional regulator with XRE-family HTH domain|nr:helix-turn-helix domain-containing protein [Lactobacillus sp.]MCH4068334.1 helix-turn-helix domain-containing protein [Lactobacillus sp.]MCI1359813.1 helix-turn-helix domain-containing protein [Lactobacillus sp.]
MEFCEAIKKKRKELGLTQSQMISGVGITRFQFSKIESGNRKMYIDDLLKMFELRGIDGKSFWDEYFDNSDKKENQETITQKLTLAFYDSDLILAEKVRNALSDMKDISEEQRYHALLICKAIKGDISNIESDEKKGMIRLLFKEEDWTKNIDSLRIFGNAMTMFDESTRHVLMKSVLKEYQCLADKKEDTQLRIAEIWELYNFMCKDEQFLKLNSNWV